MVVLVVAAVWFALSVPVALLLGRLLGAPTVELVGVEGADVLLRFPDGCVARVALAPAAVPVNS
jgi:hypothetical protein